MKSRASIILIFAEIRHQVQSGARNKEWGLGAGKEVVDSAREQKRLQQIEFKAGAMAQSTYISSGQSTGLSIRFPSMMY